MNNKVCYNDIQGNGNATYVTQTEAAKRGNDTLKWQLNLEKNTVKPNT